jgi:hypothetical protein
MLALLRGLLGQPAPQAPPGQSWYVLPLSGAPTPIHAVLPTDDSGDSATIGIGILDLYTRGKLSVLAAAYAPLFTIPIGDPVVVTGRANHPIELSLTVGLGQTVTAGGVTFDGAELICGLYVQDSTPELSLTFTLNGKPAGSVVHTLDALRSASVTAWINAMLGVDSVAAWLKRPIGASSISAGGALVTAGILNQSGGTYAFGTLDSLVGKTPTQIGETLLSVVLKVLASNDKPIVPFDGGGIWVFGMTDQGATDYGLRLQVPDVDLSPKSGPKVLLQLGKLLGGDTSESTWISRSDPKGVFPKPGVSLTLVTESADIPPTPSFRAKLDLVSIGIDVQGAASKPLVTVKGVTLGGVHPRFLFSFDLANPTRIPWGVAAQLDGLGIPLGNGVAGASANPVAQNLLSSGGASAGDKEAVNPTFSASIARVFDPAGGASLDVQLHSDGGSAQRIWIPVQRAFGPLQCRRIGIEWPKDNPNLVLDFLFDGGVKLAALTVDLEGLSLGIPLKTPGQISNYTLDLQGMGLAYASGPLTISGGFLKESDKTPVEYDGAALIQAADWSIAAFGSYASLGGQPSLFIFAQLGGELGGPPFFFVTGLCAGFGYNRSLRIPAQNEVPQFPLLAGIADPTQVGGANATPAQALAALDDWIAPAQGVDWVAAGVQFTSFELVKSNIVVTVIPTGDIQAAILGVSRIKLGQAGPQFAYAELGLSVVVHPSAGFLGISAVLSPNSYVLTQDCHLTGGFAFWIWYAGAHAGDFVVTLGGYHPAFDKPSHYPDEPRLGFSWQVNGNLTVQGDSYFALTPSCAMGGGALDIEFHSGDLRAWFTAHADFLFTWKPFYFIGDIGVSIGASYKLDLLFTSVTISVELGADLDIWGPPTGGRVHVSWFIISFSVGFGADPLTSQGFRSWDEFATLLPQQQTQLPQQQSAAQVHAMAASTDSTTPVIVTTTISDGLVRTDAGAWVVRGDAMTFAVATAFPLTQLVLAAPTGGTPVTFSPQPPADKLAVRPMGVKDVTSVMTITVTRKDGKDVLMNLGGWIWTPTLQGVPAALWGPPLDAGATPTTPSADTLPGRLVGVAGLTPPTSTPTGPGPIPLAILNYFPLDGGLGRLPLSAAEPPVPRQPQPTPSSPQKIADTIVASATARTDLFAALAALGYDAGANGDVGEIKANANVAYPDAPMLGAPWREAA